ncbi:hypothetical protein O6H91_02G083300 [Diphasiastrum complanatum]|uniref:Uncharacterized protein n=1 Tax=Diphasiastrum complanatum TaxID=34168 RepID=A0ACC2EHT3_DIPCM|nr:hypothetical protein O6H91_02G083300 [Diphasiastrum complanatum]
MAEANDSTVIRFLVNGKQVIKENPDPRTILGDFLRDELGLRGLKLPCTQGDCGACTVIISPLETRSFLENNGSKFPDHRPINSCLKPLCSVDGFSVTTIEGVGSHKKGLHAVQKSLVQHNGTQCGFCTPGMIMSMFGLLLDNPTPGPQQIESQLDGNLCRCTGYRPILDAFQTFSCKIDKSPTKGADLRCTRQQVDIEDLGVNARSLPYNKELKVSRDGYTWIRVNSQFKLYDILKANEGITGIRLVRGNTSIGVYPQDLAKVSVDISSIPVLSQVNVNEQGITIGGAATITDLMVLLESNNNLSPSYNPLLKHLKRVATPQVRNIGSVAGNLVMAYKHHDFISDIATILVAAEATIKIYSAFEDGPEVILDLHNFFTLPSLEGVVILEIHIPRLKAESRIYTFKAALRRVNAHPLLNAAYKFDIDPEKGLIRTPPVIVYGGIQSLPVRARKTESFLFGRSFMKPQVLDDALEILQKELILDTTIGRTAYRSSLVAAYFYKAMLSLWPKDSLPPRLRSSVAEQEWPISTGEISFDEGDPSEYPVSKPLPKLSAEVQATGEAQYLDDLRVGDELHATYVLSTVANATLISIDPSKALQMKGVVTFISASTVAEAGYCNKVSEYEEVFASSLIKYYGQALGLIVATSKEFAKSAAELVEVQYGDMKPAIISIEDAISANSFFEDRSLDFERGSIEESFKDAHVIVEGEVGVGHQYHFHLETQRALCIPSEDGYLSVYSSTQNPSQVHSCVSNGLGRPQHKITVHVKRVGGAYGAKLNRTATIAMACAFAADKLQRPVRLVLDMSTNMKLVGARSPYLCKYKVGAQKSGRITAVDMLLINNQGAHFDFEYPDGSTVIGFIDNVYNIHSWKIQMKIARTNLPACTYMRGPVFVEVTFMLETVVEHISAALKVSPDVVRQLNMYTTGEVTLAGQTLNYCNAKAVFNELKESSNYIRRCQDVNDFNARNQMVKRGICLVPVKFNAVWESNQQLALVNIFPDSSISIHQSGCELGQGLDVKIAQVAAMSLGVLVKGGVEISNIAVHTTTTVVANNVGETGGSVTSELCGKAVLDACQQLVARLQVVSKFLTSRTAQPTWKELITAAIASGIDLQARGRVYAGAGKNGPFQYISFGAGVTEAEVDMLTGEVTLLRCDLLLDCGKSLNPAIDIGQVQGAFVQGLGYYLTEEYRYNCNSGKLLTDSTWDYKPPSSRDIPYDFRAALLPKSSNPSGFLRSKFSGEPPYGMACSALLAVRQAIQAAKSEWGENGWCPLSAPATIDKVALAANAPLSIISFRELINLSFT